MSIKLFWILHFTRHLIERNDIVHVSLILPKLSSSKLSPSNVLDVWSRFLFLINEEKHKNVSNCFPHLPQAMVRMLVNNKFSQNITNRVIIDVNRSRQNKSSNDKNYLI